MQQVQYKKDELENVHCQAKRKWRNKNWKLQNSRENKVCVVRWKNDKVVTCATNFVTVKNQNLCDSFKSISHYNKYMGGADKTDKPIVAYRTDCENENGGGLCFVIYSTNTLLLMRKIHQQHKDCSTCFQKKYDKQIVYNISISLLYLLEAKIIKHFA